LAARSIWLRVCSKPRRKGLSKSRFRFMGVLEVKRL